MAVRIVTDSVADLPPSVAKEANITVVPLYVHIGEATFLDSVELNADQFYSHLARSTNLPRTSQPSISDFKREYQKILDEGHQVLSIHVSSKLSGTYNSAVQARYLCSNPAAVDVIDSQLAGGALALLTLGAATWASHTADLEGLAHRVRFAIPRHECFVMVDTLKYLQMGGRIGMAQAFLGGMLRFKPIVCIRNGETSPVARPRTRKRALARLVEIVREQAPIDRLHISYTTGAEVAANFTGELVDVVTPDAIVQSRFGPVLGTHLGPNAIAVAFRRTFNYAS
ncbi:MAG: DegV family protein [Chloroflexi bacterium]|nr:DegV family protein [Chloroflexota bacterium]